MIYMYTTVEDPSIHIVNYTKEFQQSVDIIF